MKYIVVFDFVFYFSFKVIYRNKNFYDTLNFNIKYSLEVYLKIVEMI